MKYLTAVLITVFSLIIVTKADEDKKLGINLAKGMAATFANVNNPGEGSYWKWHKTSGGNIQQYAPGVAEISQPGLMVKHLDLGKFKNQIIDWKKYNGISFRVKGDGSNNYGSIMLRLAWNYYFYYEFPVKNKNWVNYNISFKDFAPYGANLNPINSPKGISLDNLCSIAIGSTWKITHKNRQITPFSYLITDIKFCRNAKAKTALGKFNIRPLREVLKLMKNGSKVRIACVGDSITAGTCLHNADKERYSSLLQAELRRYFKNPKIDVTCLGVGGARIHDSLIWSNRDFDNNKYDLITLMIGFNDKSLKVPADLFKEYINYYIDISEAKNEGNAAFILIPTIPGGLDRFAAQDDYAEKVREIADKRKLPLCDVAARFRAMGKAGLAEYLADDAHPNAAGHKLFADILTKFIIKASQNENL